MQVKLKNFIATKEMHLYELIPWSLDKIENETNNFCKHLKSCINNVWKATTSGIPIRSEIDIARKIGVGLKLKKQHLRLNVN